MPQPVASAHSGQAAQVQEATRVLRLQGKTPAPCTVVLVTPASCCTLLLFFLNCSLYYFGWFLQFADVVSNSSPVLPGTYDPSWLVGAYGWKMYPLLSTTKSIS